jgi:hypothetical protein
LVSQIGRYAIEALTGGDDDIFILHQHKEQLLDYKKELSDVGNSLLTVDVKEEDEVAKPLFKVEVIEVYTLQFTHTRV